MRSRTPHPYPNHPFPSSVWRVLHPCLLLEGKIYNEIVLGKTLKSIHNHTELTGIWQIQVDISIFVICIRFMKGKTEHSQYVSDDMSQMTGNMCISCPLNAVLAYWDPGGLASCSRFWETEVQAPGRQLWVRLIILAERWSWKGHSSVTMRNHQLSTFIVQVMGTELWAIFLGDGAVS